MSTSTKHFQYFITYKVAPASKRHGGLFEKHSLAYSSGWFVEGVMS